MKMKFNEYVESEKSSHKVTKKDKILAARRAKIENRKREIEDAVIDSIELGAPTPVEVIEFVNARCGHYHTRSLIRIIYRIMGIEITEKNLIEFEWILL